MKYILWYKLRYRYIGVEIRVYVGKNLTIEYKSRFNIENEKYIFVKQRIYVGV